MNDQYALEKIQSFFVLKPYIHYKHISIDFIGDYL